MQQPSASAFLEPSAAAAEPKSRAKSCTECRQVKLKCDYREKAPDPCTRCAKRGLECKKDASFKRVPSRTRRRAAVSPSASSQASEASRSGVPLNVGTPQEGQRPDRLLRLQAFSGGETFALGDVTLSAHTAVSILRHFDEHLWVHLPVLEPIRSLPQLYSESHLLFWALIAVSCRFHPKRSELYEKITVRYEATLYPQLFLGPPSVKKVHAILLLCLWPFPVASQQNDATHVLAGAAVNTAMQLGLHRANVQADYFEGLTPMVASESSVRDSTWLACVQATTSISLFLDLPPPVTNPSTLRTITALSSSPCLLPSTRASSTIQSRATRLLAALDSGLDSSTSQQLLQLFEHDLSQARSAFASAWTPELEIELLFTDLYCSGVAFLPEATDPVRTLERARAVLKRGLALAVSIINAVAISPSSPVQSPTIKPPPAHTSLPAIVERARYYPKAFFRHVAFAAYFLLFYISTPVPPSSEHPSPHALSQASTPHFHLPRHLSSGHPSTDPIAPFQISPFHSPHDFQTAQSALSFAVAFLTSLPNEEGVRIGRSIALKAKYALSSHGKVPIQSSSRLARTVIGSFDRLGTFLRSASLASSQQQAVDPMSASSRSTMSPVSASTSPESTFLPAPMGVGVGVGQVPGAWMGQDPFGTALGMDVGGGEDMGQVFQGMEMWDLGQEGWGDVDYEALAQGMMQGQQDQRD